MLLKKTLVTVIACVVNWVLISAQTSDSACDDLDTGSCVFKKHSCDDKFVKEIERLRPLFGKRYTHQEKTAAETYDYSVGICTTAQVEIPPQYAMTGALQQEESSKVLHGLGNITQAEIKSGRDWIELEYEGGQNYSRHCHGELRRSIIMITCLPGESEGILSLTNEYNQKSDDCFYLFELAVDAACEAHSSSGISVGTIVCIVFFSLLAVYVVGGFIYQRFIVGAKGMEQFPHYAFWQDFGNLQADGCDLIFRRGPSTAGSRQYRGIGDDQLQSQMEEADTDEHLLPM